MVGPLARESEAARRRPRAAFRNSLESDLPDDLPVRYYSRMTARQGDTSPDALRIMTELYRAMRPADKLERVRDLTIAVNRLAATRIRELHPDEDEGTMLLRLARRRLGAAVVDRAYMASSAQ